MKEKKDENRINIRVKPQLKEDLKDVAEALEIPTSQIVRDAVKEKLAELRKNHHLLAEVSAN